MRVLTLITLIAASTAAQAIEQMTPAKASQIADAIYRVEGGAKARVPYGILSVKVKDEAEARRVCINTVVNNHRRWVKAGRHGSYYDWLADRYCPSSVDPIGNRNWKNNIKRIVTVE